MALNLPDAWRAHIDHILAHPGITVAVGDVDTGKTSFCALLANCALEKGISTAVVDCDLGQSEIGPPGTIGLGIVGSPIASLGDLEPEELYFVGTTSPVGHLLAMVTGTGKLVGSPTAADKELIIVDTPGLVSGLLGRKLQSSIIEALPARHIVALQKAKEAEHFLRFFDTWADCDVHRLPIAPGIHAKSPILRTQRRASRFHAYFTHGNSHELPLRELATSGTWLRTGDTLEPRYLKFAEKSLQTEVLHGERIDRGIYLVVKSDYNRRGLDALQEQFKTRSIVTVPANRYPNLLVGLMDEHLHVLALGIVKGISFRSQTISVYTPLRSIAPVRSIRFGVLKVRPDGTEIGSVRPGEL
ncbi:MAG TPA: Clp1/GlmU family protein [Armatimonadota bacterium]|jgi:polynucleotide 5'-hydroxyl-kinase GRC3/NOL9